jgi:hypothetical protein
MCSLVRDNSISLETYKSLSEILSNYRGGDIISTAIVIADIRNRLPTCECNDEELVGLIVHAVAGQGKAIAFDQRGDPGLHGCRSYPGKTSPDFRRAT